MADILRELDAEADAEYELESEEGSLFSGSVMLIGAMTMAWAGVAFAYFYLRQLDSPPLFRAGLRAPELLGDLIGVSILAGAILYSWAINRLRSGMAFEFELAAWLACGCACVASGLQAWELTRLGFAPGTTGYTSVFIGYGILSVGFTFYGAICTEMVAARALRLRGAERDRVRRRLTASAPSLRPVLVALEPFVVRAEPRHGPTPWAGAAGPSRPVLVADSFPGGGLDRGHRAHPPW